MLSKQKQNNYCYSINTVCIYRYSGSCWTRRSACDGEIDARENCKSIKSPRDDAAAAAGSYNVVIQPHAYVCVLRARVCVCVLDIVVHLMDELLFAYVIDGASSDVYDIFVAVRPRPEVAFMLS